MGAVAGWHGAEAVGETVGGKQANGGVAEAWGGSARLEQAEGISGKAAGRGRRRGGMDGSRGRGDRVRTIRAIA